MCLINTNIRSQVIKGTGTITATWDFVLQEALGSVMHGAKTEKPFVY